MTTSIYRILKKYPLVGELARNNVLTVIALAYDGLLGTIQSVLLARLTGVELLGIYTASQTLIGIIYNITHLGVQVPVAREVARDVGAIRRYMGSALGIRLCITTPLTIIIAIITGSILKVGAWPINALMAVFFVLSGFSSLLLDTLRSINRFDLNLKTSIAYRTLWFIVSILILFWSGNLLLMMGATCVVQGLNFLLLIRVLNSTGIKLNFWWQWREWRLIIKESLPVVLAGTTNFISLRSDGLLLAIFIGNQASGIYGAAYSVYLLAAIFCFAVAQATFPTLSRYAHQHSLMQYFRLVVKMCVAVVALGLVFSLTGSVVSPYLLPVIYGPQYRPSIAPLIIILWALPFLALNRLMVQALNAAKFQKWTFYATVCGTIFNVAANFWLIPQFGYIAAAFTTVLTEAIVGITAIFGLWKLTFVSEPINTCHHAYATTPGLDSQ